MYAVYPALKPNISSNTRLYDYSTISSQRIVVLISEAIQVEILSNGEELIQ
jgi:hypothetical protein